MCAIYVYLCVIFKIFKCIFMSFILYKPLAIWPPGHDISLLIKSESELQSQVKPKL